MGKVQLSFTPTSLKKQSTEEDSIVEKYFFCSELPYETNHQNHKL